MESNESKLESLEVLLNDLYSDLKENLTLIIEKTILHREIYMDSLKDKLEDSLPEKMKKEI